ncbi:MAG: hypothetical protein B9S33_21010 [Pedosphaera sp. Tous-C6FEB]|nr:MAG: hypothetical protein B9S33_21010 [Pedosphaera sp. Tous-C6FEB]
MEITSSLVEALPEETSEGAAADARAARAAAALPCLFETTASEEDSPPPLPGPRRKQAQALTDNIKWLADIFGNERIGFLTLTLGDVDAGGRFRNLRDRKEAQRRFHSLLTNEIAKRYQCGVTVTERHHNGGIHFHLVVVCRKDIRGDIDFAVCFPPKDGRGKPQYAPDYATANAALRQEWAYWRRTAKHYGFGRHQLQPMRANSEALGRYLGAYLRKDWDHRLPEDKGARCVRYFGHWSKVEPVKGQRKAAPPYNARFGWLTPRARAWREMLKQVVLVLRYHGTEILEANIKDIIGNRWAWRMGKLFEAVQFETEHVADAATREAIEEHNFKVEVRWLSGGGDPTRCCCWHVTEVTLDHLRPSPEWKKEGEMLQLVKEAEAAIRRGLRRLAERRKQEADQLQLLREVGDSLEEASWPF